MRWGWTHRQRSGTREHWLEMGRVLLLMWVIVTWACSPCEIRQTIYVGNMYFSVCCLFWLCCVTNHPKLSGIKQWPFYSAGNSNKTQQEWYICFMISGASSRKFKHLEVTGIIYMSDTWTGITQRLTSAGTVKQSTDVWLLLMTWTSHNMAASFQEGSSWQGASGQQAFLKNQKGAAWTFLI